MLGRPSEFARVEPDPLCSGHKKRAGEGIRTLDIHVGNVVLYH